MDSLNSRIKENVAAIVRELVVEVEELVDGTYSVDLFTHDAYNAPKYTEYHRRFDVAGIRFTEMVHHETSGRVIIAHLEPLPNWFIVKNGQLC
jgi:hypothetical protein